MNRDKEEAKSKLEVTLDDSENEVKGEEAVEDRTEEGKLRLGSLEKIIEHRRDRRRNRHVKDNVQEPHKGKDGAQETENTDRPVLERGTALFLVRDAELGKIVLQVEHSRLKLGVNLLVLAVAATHVLLFDTLANLNKCRGAVAQEDLLTGPRGEIQRARAEVPSADKIKRKGHHPNAAKDGKEEPAQHGHETNQVHLSLRLKKNIVKEKYEFTFYDMIQNNMKKRTRTYFFFLFFFFPKHVLGMTWARS